MDEEEEKVEQIEDIEKDEVEIQRRNSVEAESTDKSERRGSTMSDEKQEQVHTYTTWSARCHAASRVQCRPSHSHKPRLL